MALVVLTKGLTQFTGGESEDLIQEGLVGLYKAIRRGVFRVIGDGENLVHPIFIDDLVRPLEQESGRPQAIGEVGALRLELGCEAAVQEDRAAVPEGDPAAMPSTVAPTGTSLSSLSDV